MANKFSALPVIVRFRLKKDKPLFTAVLLFLLAGILLLAFYLFRQVSSVTLREDIYRFNTGVRVDYTGRTRLFRRDGVTVLQNGGNEISLDAQPVYFADQERLVTPALMAVVLPKQDKMGKVAYYTQVYREGADILSGTGRQTASLNEGFLFDGKDTYIFLDKTLVKWGERSVVLEPFSFAVVVYNQRLELYPFEGGEPVLDQTGDMEVIAISSSGYSIDLSRDILRMDTGERLLFSQPSLLEDIQ